jgi:hypothetical protein
MPGNRKLIGGGRSCQRCFSSSKAKAKAKATAYYTDISLRNVTLPGSYCLKTSEGRTAFVTIVDTSGPVVLKVTVWDPPGSS